MNVKFVIFLPISVLLVATIYGSSVTDVCALKATECNDYKGQDGSTYRLCCVWEIFEEGNGNTASVHCTKCTGENGSCKTFKTSMDSMLDKLNEEITGTGTNDTKAPKTDVLKEESLLNNTKIPEDFGRLKDEDRSPTINPNLP